MKFFTKSHKNKKAGLSLLLAMIGSTIALSIVVSIVAIVVRSVEQSQDLERSTQVFFAIESGLEAGFFHHNARGQGVQFVDINSVPQEQIIVHSVTTLNSSWTLDGRATSTILTGLIYENTPLHLRWFWDTSTKVTDTPSIVHNVPDFTLTFDPNDQIPVNFDFGSIENNVLISWLLTRKDTLMGISSLSSMADNPEALCTNPTSFVCRDEILSSTSIHHNDVATTGRLLPRTIATTFNTIDQFISASITDPDFQLILTPTLGFQDSVGAKISGIPFEITGSYNLPRSEYSIHTATIAGDFSKKFNLLKIPEQTSIQAFNYVIFD